MFPKPGFCPYYGWVIVVSAFIIMQTYGVFYSYGLFLSAIENEFGWSRSTTAGAFSLFMVVYSAMGVPMGWLFNRYGPRLPLWLAALLIGTGIFLCGQMSLPWQLYVCFGIVASIGHSAIYVVPVSTVMNWFTSRRGLVLGFVIAGIGVGTVIIPLLTNYLIRSYEWRPAFRIMGVSVFVIIAAMTTLMKRSPEDIGMEPHGQALYGPRKIRIIGAGHHKLDDNLTIRQALKDRNFWLLYVASVFAFGAEQMTIVHIVPFAEGIGTTRNAAVGAVPMIGIGIIIGRIALGAISDWMGSRRTLIVASSMQAAALFLLVSAKSERILYLDMIGIGFSYGAWAVLIPSLLGEYFGVGTVSRLLGIWLTVGVISSLGPLLGGVAFDITGAYSRSFFVAGTACILAVVFISMIKRPKWGLQRSSVG